MRKGLLGIITTGIELACIVGLAGIGLKRNNDCYNAEMKLIEAEFERDMAEFSLLRKNAEIEDLKAKLKKLELSKEEEA